MHLRVIGFAAMAALWLEMPAIAGDLDAFNAAIEQTAAHNRAAIGYLRTENVDLAAVELQDMQKAWGAVAERFGGDRPDKFRDNELYVTMLVDVPTRIVGALIMINFGRPDIAGASLQAIRREFSAVRRASGVEVLADCVLDANDAMEAFSVYRDDPPDWEKPAVTADVAAKAEAFGAAIRRCDALAPDAIRSKPEFRRLVDGVAASLTFVPKAIASRDSDLLHRVIGELRAFDNLLSFRYG